MSDKDKADGPNEAPLKFEIENVDELQEQLKRESEPMWITNKFVESPCKVMCSFYFVLIICGVLSVIFKYMVPKLAGGRNRDFAIVHDPI